PLRGPAAMDLRLRAADPLDRDDPRPPLAMAAAPGRRRRQDLPLPRAGPVCRRRAEAGQRLPHRWHRLPPGPRRRRADRAAMNTTKVIRFNWPKYAGALALVTAALVADALRAPGWISYPLWGVCAPGVAWTLTSLAATWWVYDHRKVYQQLAT